MSIQENVLKIKGEVTLFIKKYPFAIIMLCYMGIMVGCLIGIGYFVGMRHTLRHMNREEGIAFIPEEKPTLPCDLYPHIPETTSIPSVVQDTKNSLTTGQKSSSDILQPFLASRNGKTYYPRLCAGARRIKEENRVYFTSTQEAEQQGYRLSKTCQKSS